MSPPSQGRTLHIVHVIATLIEEHGGPTKACLELARTMARRGHRADILTTDFGTGLNAPAAGITVQRDGVTLRHFPRSRPHTIFRSAALGRALPDSVAQADVVHLHSLYLYHDWATARVCRRLGKPYLLMPHGALDPFMWQHHRLRKRVVEMAYQDRVTRGAAAVHFTSAEEARLAEPYVHGRPGLVLPLGIDPEDYAALPARGGFRACHPEIGNRRILLYLGRLNFKKGLDVLAAAFGRLLAVHDDLHLVVAGPDEAMRGPLEKWLQAAGAAGRTSIVGMVRGEAKMALLADADLFVLPSYSENFGLAVVEALACGLPVVISDRVNIWREVCADGAGIAVPPEPEAVARAIHAILAEPGRREAMAALGPGTARTFAWDGIGARLEDAYRGLAFPPTGAPQ